MPFYEGASRDQGDIVEVVDLEEMLGMGFLDGWVVLRDKGVG